MQNVIAVGSGSDASAGMGTSRPGKRKRFVASVRNLWHRRSSPNKQNVVVPDNPPVIVAPTLPVATPGSVVGPTSVGTVVMGTADTSLAGVTVTADRVPGQAVASNLSRWDRELR